MSPLPSKLYNILKFVATIVLPALATLVITLGNTWDLSHTAEVATSITGINVFLGTILGLSTRAYNNSEAKFDGAIVTNVTEEGTKVFSLELNTPPDEIDNMDSILFKVVGPQTP